MKTHTLILCKYYITMSLWKSYQCLKSVQIRSNFWSVFSHIRTEYGEIRSQPEYGKIQTRNYSVFGHFSRSVCSLRFLINTYERLSSQQRFETGSQDSTKYEVLDIYVNYILYI